MSFSFSRGLLGGNRVCEGSDMASAEVCVVVVGIAAGNMSAENGQRDTARMAS